MSFLINKKIPNTEDLIKAVDYYPELDPSACEVFLHLINSSIDVTNDVEAYFLNYNLTQARFFVLFHLLDKHTKNPVPRTPAYLAELSAVTRSSMTSLLDTLEKDSLITRQPHSSDHRMVYVFITPKGQKLVNDSLPGHLKNIADMMSSLSIPERKRIILLLSKISKNLRNKKY